MLKTDVLNQQGQPVGSVELDERVFAVKPQRGLIEQAIVTILANRRQVLAHTKTRGDVRGGGKKPWRQKGTGRARQGSIRSPQWKGGGVVHGPRKNRNYSLKMNNAARRQALRMALTDKLNHQRLTIIDGIKLTNPKTKEFAAVLKALPKAKTSLLIIPASAPELVRAGRNIPGVTFIRADSLNTYDLVRNERLFVLRDSLPVITNTYVKA